MKKFFSQIGHFLAFPFVAVALLWSMFRIKSKANKYRRDKNAIFPEERFKVVYKLCKKILFIKNVKVTIEDFEHLPTKSKLFVFNHKSNLDPIVLIKVLYEKLEGQCFSFVCKRELASKKIIKAAIDLIDGIYIDRDNPRQVFEIIDKQKQLIAKNYSIVISPEGTRVYSDEINEYKSGVFKIAFDCFIPIISLTIYGTSGRLDKTKTNKKKGPVFVKVNKIIRPKEFITTNILNVSNEIRNSTIDSYVEIMARQNLKKQKK